MHYIIVHATDALASKLSVYSGRSSVEHWGGPFSLQRAWPAENFPECSYITEDSYYIASNNCRT